MRIAMAAIAPDVIDVVARPRIVNRVRMGIGSGQCRQRQHEAGRAAWKDLGGRPR
jgi:hypothetical protein